MFKIKKLLLFLMFLVIDIVIVLFVYKYFPFELYDILYLTLFVGCVEFCLLVPSTSGIDNDLINKSEGIYKTAYIRKNAWLKSNLMWMIINYWIIAASFLATLIVIYVAVDEINGTIPKFV